MNDYYTAQASRLLWFLDWIMRRLRPYLAAAYGDDLADEIVTASRPEFEAILPELPYVGGYENLFMPIVIASGGMLAIYRAMHRHGKTAEEMFVIFCQLGTEALDRMPGLATRLMGRLMLGKYGGKWVLSRLAARSQKRRYPGDWVFTVIEGDGKEFDWGVEYTECAVVKFWQDQGAEELLPYCNFGDILMSRAWGMGMEVSTPGEGCETCVARFKRGRETQMRDWMPGSSFQQELQPTEI